MNGQTDGQQTYLTCICMYVDIQITFLFKSLIQTRETKIVLNEFFSFLLKLTHNKTPKCFHQKTVGKVIKLDRKKEYLTMNISINTKLFNWFCLIELKTNKQKILLHLLLIFRAEIGT